MELNARKDKKALVLSVKGRMDATSSSQFEKEISEFMKQGEKDFIIDLRELDYISSAGLRSILSTMKKLKVKEGKLFLAALKGVVKETFEISGFITIIPVYESVELALSGL